MFTLLFIGLIFIPTVFANDSKQRIYDYANLLTDEEIERLEQLAYEHSEKRNTDFIIITSPDADEKDIIKYVQDFYDDMAPGFDKSHGNTAILALDMDDSDVYLAGFYKAEKNLDDSRMDIIRNKITPYLSSEDYYEAFTLFIETGSRYIRYVPGVNPDSFLFDTWFHILVALGIGMLVVGTMAYNSGGKVTVNERTYTGDFKVLKQKDVYLTKSVTKRKKPSNNSSGGGGGGGGITSGGHSHSGSRGSF
jgi:uncharacterized protein